MVGVLSLVTRFPASSGRGIWAQMSAHELLTGCIESTQLNSFIEVIHSVVVLGNGNGSMGTVDLAKIGALLKVGAGARFRYQVRRVGTFLPTSLSKTLLIWNIEYRQFTPTLHVIQTGVFCSRVVFGDPLLVRVSPVLFLPVVRELRVPNDNTARAAA